MFLSTLIPSFAFFFKVLRGEYMSTCPQRTPRAQLSAVASSEKISRTCHRALCKYQQTRCTRWPGSNKAGHFKNGRRFKWPSHLECKSAKKPSVREQCGRTGPIMTPPSIPTGVQLEQPAMERAGWRPTTGAPCDEGINPGFRGGFYGETGSAVLGW